MTQLDGKVVLVTGATDGMGQALAIELAGKGATVLVHGRDPARISAAVAEVAKAAGGSRNVRGYIADFASLAEVATLSERITAGEPRIDVLVNNAGIGINEPGGGARQESRDGIELRFAVNYLAGYVLTRQLLPVLKASAPSKVVNVASIGQQAIDFDDPMLTKDYDGWRAYRQSKLAQIMFSFDLAEELKDAGVTVNALHPATFMPTKVSPAPPISTIEQGVQATLRLITAPEAETGTGRYFNSQDESTAHDQAYDLTARRQLRDLSERLTISH